MELTGLSRPCSSFFTEEMRFIISAGEAVRALRPGVDDLVVLLALGDQAVLVLLLVILREGTGLLDDLPLVLRDHHVVLAERDAGLERIVEAERP